MLKTLTMILNPIIHSPIIFDSRSKKMNDQFSLGPLLLEDVVLQGQLHFNGEQRSGLQRMVKFLALLYSVHLRLDQRFISGRRTS